MLRISTNGLTDGQTNEQAWRGNKMMYIWYPLPTTYLQCFINLALIHCKLSHDPNNGQGSDTSSQYGDHFCQIVVKSDFK